MPTSTTGRSNKQAGFTLIELMLVVVLLGMLASFALPMLSGLEPDRMNASARRLAGTVKYLYNEAAMTGYEHRLVFDLGNGSYRADQVEVTGELQAKSGIGKSHKLRDGVYFASIYQPQRGEQNSGEMTTAILPGGWLEETIIHLRNDEDRKLTLRLVPMTGLTEIYDGYREFR